MGHFVTDEVDRIKIDKDHWVDIKRKMNYGEQQELVASYMKAGMQEGQKTPNIDVNFEMGGITLLSINIKAWNLTDEKGNIAPITVDKIKALDPNIAGKIAIEINKRNPPPKA